MKKIISLVLVICIFSLFVTSAVAQTSSICNQSTVGSAELITSEGNVSYYISEDRLLKAVVIAPNNFLTSPAARTSDGIMTAFAEVNVEFYESAPLSMEDILMIRSGELTKYQEEVNPMGNVKAKLYVDYSWSSYSNPNLLRLISATSDYSILKNEGVIPQTCSLYWNAAGDIYDEGEYSRRGEIGDTINYTSPTFTNIQLMPESQGIDPLVAGVNYTLYCTRGVTITVYMSIYEF